MSSSELHLGITPWRLGSTLDAPGLCEQARQAEAWGYQSFFLPENHFEGNSPIPDPLLLLAAVAGTTERMLLGTTSWLLPIRQPLLAAEQAASLDRLCGGRLILGLGRGYRADMLGAFGVTNADKRDRFENVLSAMREAWAGQPVAGEQSLSPLPQQAPHPPLWVAAFGPKAIGQAGKLGLPYFASPVESFAELDANFARHLEALAEHGNTCNGTRAIMRTVFISEDAKRVDAVRQKLAGLPSPPFRKGDNPAPDDCALLGNRGEVAEKIQRYREALNLTHLVAVRPRVPGIEPDWITESFAALADLRLAF